jgi:GH18 family chitinase
MQKIKLITEQARKSIKFFLALLLAFSLGLSPSFAADTGGDTISQAGGDPAAQSDKEAAVQIDENAAAGDQFKVVGYYSGSLFDEPVEKLQTDKLTHVIYAFLIPREDGGLEPLEKPDQLRELVEQAHRDGAKVLIALGGWSYQGQPLYPVFESAVASDEKRAELVKNVRDFVDEHGLDGVELDWEYPNQYSIGNYDKLVAELKAALDQDGKELTAALNGAWSATAGPEASLLMTDASLECFNFISVMAYDMNNAEHSPLWFADTSINYWLNRGVPAEKIILGMPLYARPSWKQYRQLAAENPEYAYIDYVAGEPESWYNGLNTLREKTYIAMKKAGGVMLFDVNEDTAGETSVVSMIRELQNRAKSYSKEDLRKYITIILDNRELVFLPEEGLGVPFIDVNSRTMIPFKKPMEAIGAAVTYDADNRTVTAVKDNTAVILTIGEKEFFVNGEMTAMDTEAVIKDDRTYIPLTAVFNAFGYDVAWHGSSNTVYITRR